MLYHGRTDLASESLGQVQGKEGELGALEGISASREELHGLSVSSVDILDERGAQILGKPQGRYYSLELPRHFHRGGPDFSSCVLATAELIRRCARGPSSVLVAGLGNPDMSPDALGPLAGESVIVTRHLKEADPAFRSLCSVALCRPGVLADSGIESARQVALLAEAIKPELVVAIDALAGADGDMLCRCIQISTVGICPGSGVGNDRQELSRATLGCPVVSIGVPTVLDAALLGAKELEGLFLTTRDIDAQVRSAARVIGYGLDLALSPGLSLEDVDMLIG